MIVHQQTGQIFQNRKEAKQTMGHSRFNHALRDKEIVFVSALTD